MIYITGDTHADFRRFGVKYFPEQKDMTKDDYVIICGDFGGVWRDCEEEQYWLDWLEDKPFTTLFVDGNHDNFDRLYSDEFETIDFKGGKAQKIRNSVIHLKRGYVFTLEDKKFFAFGGASSHDIDDGILDLKDYKSKEEFHNTVRLWSRQGKMFRIRGLSWWDLEMPTETEMLFGKRTLSDNDYKVDYVISHCLPQTVASVISHGFYKPDELTGYFDELLENGLEFNDWYCGHYHVDKDVMLKFHIRYDRIERIV